jgi:DNA-binding response OmpR family regulator
VGLDGKLPGMDGFENPRRLRHESRVPVIMPTARGEDEDRILGLQPGADDYLARPRGEAIGDECIPSSVGFKVLRAF